MKIATWCQPAGHFCLLLQKALVPKHILSPIIQSPKTSQYIYHSKPIQQVPFLQLPATSLHHPRLLGVGSLRLREGESRKWGDGLPPSQAPGWLLNQPSALSAIEHHSLTHNLNHMVGRHASMHFQSSDLEPLYRQTNSCQ